MTISIRPVRADDASAWRSLYAGYRSFYKLAEDAAAVERTWSWVLLAEHSLFGLVAVDADGALVALANLRWFARPSTGTIGLYLDDLFTAPAARGSGAGAALLDRAASIAHGAGASVVRWITASDNATARHLYDAHATATSWVTYDLAPTAGESQA